MKIAIQKVNRVTAIRHHLVLLAAQSKMNTSLIGEDREMLMRAKSNESTSHQSYDPAGPRAIRKGLREASIQTQIEDRR